MAATDNGAGTVAPFDLRDLTRPEGPTPFQFVAQDGTEFTLPGPADLNIALVLDIGEAAPAQVFRLLLGDQWDRFAASDTPMWKIEPLLEKWGKHYGIDLGESSASPPLSAPTEEPSRPTSPTTTTVASPTSAPAG
jgi:hypothetical protein